MAKLEDSEKEISWGTWEELLLACAVNRYGTKNWESVAMEIQNRSSSSFRFLLNPESCKQKYQDLHRRFMAKDDKIEVVENKSETENKKNDKIPWLEELRKLRVAELRCEVQRYDVSIVSLQSKVNRLKEEREQSFRDEQNSDLNPDLERKSSDAEKKEGESQPENRLSPVDVAEKSVSGEENQSFNESNSTDPKSEDQKPDGNEEEEEEKKPEPVEPVSVKPDPVEPDSKPVGERSYNGSSDTIAKDSVVPAVDKSSEAIPTREPGDSPELWESVAESKGGGDEGTKESSDVQSSASLSKKNRRTKEVSGSSSGEEPETDEVSPAINRISVKSQPLTGFLEKIRSHKFGSIFERRLESQESEEYNSLIRQHLDLETVQTRLKEGRYSSCSRKFFRDLLILINNAIVFFSKNSVEYIAAIELRELVSKEMAKRIRKSREQPEEPNPPTTVPVLLDPKQKLELSDSLLVKPKSSGPIIACRKRSSISTKASTITVVEKKEEKKVELVEEKPESPSPNIVQEKKRKRERSVSGARSSRTNSKSRSNNTTNKNSNSNQNPSPSSNPSSLIKGGAVDDNNNSEMKTDKDKDKDKEKKNNNVANVAKKRSVANFLNRMKRNSSSSNGTLLETLKNSGNNSNSNNEKGGGRAVEQKKSGGKNDGRKEQVSRASSSRKQVQQEQISPAKRSVGRPPKRTNTPAPLPPPASSKRRRETVETDVGSSRQPRKRTRR